MRKLFSLIVVACSALPALAQITPANPVVVAGTTQTFSAPGTITWSLLAGSAGTIDPDGTYHAPASIIAPKSIGGCQIGAPDSVFNTRIDNLPVHSSSASWISMLPLSGITLDPSWGNNIVDNSTPTTTFNFFYTPTYNSQTFQMAAWPALKRESGIFSDPLLNNDRHVLTVNRQTCQMYDIYNNYPAGTLGSTPPDSLYTAQSGWQYPSMSYGLPTNGATDASGMPLAPTTLNLDDIRAGVINHALRVTFSNGYIAFSFVWPATTNAGAGGFVPYGSRFRLKSSFDISGFSPTAQIILTALKQYGMIISDGGINWDIVTSTDITADRTVQAARLEIQSANATLNASQFEIVDESSLMVSAGSSLVAYGNGYETPSAFAIVKADDGVHTPLTMPIALQAKAALNSPDGGGVWIQSGVTKTLTVFGGTSVTWSMSPTVGTINLSTGVYVAPAETSPTTTSITATSTIDPAVSVTFPLTVFPAGVIRISSGDATGNALAPNTHSPDYGPDSSGNMWWRDQSCERSGGVKNDYYYPDTNWPHVTDWTLFQTQFFNYGDTVCQFSVPNGRYNIDYYVAEGDFGSCNFGGVAGQGDPLAFRAHLEAQGVIAIHDYYPLVATGGACYTPAHATIPAVVTDGTLYFALRHISDRTQASNPEQYPLSTISAFSITPVTTPPVSRQRSGVTRFTGLTK
jgi:hypothetical protein